MRSLEVWKPRATQVPPQLPMGYNLRVLASSMWVQGVRSPYKMEYWKYLYQLISRHAREPAKLWLGFNMLLSAHHFLIYSREVAESLEKECVAIAEREVLSPKRAYSETAAARLAARA